ncbi:MAG: hypothetical protein QMD96_03320 [Anaerosomatales bacterium]|nr:hypothetical protein [Anaerosomatales bacterium]
MLVFMLGVVVLAGNAFWVSIREMRKGKPFTVRSGLRALAPGWIDCIGALLVLADLLARPETGLTIREVGIAIGGTLLILLGMTVGKAQMLSWVYLYLVARERAAAAERPQQSDAGGEPS